MASATSISRRHRWNAWHPARCRAGNGRQVLLHAHAQDGDPSRRLQPRDNAGADGCPGSRRRLAYRGGVHRPAIGKHHQAAGAPRPAWPAARPPGWTASPSMPSRNRSGLSRAAISARAAPRPARILEDQVADLVQATGARRPAMRQPIQARAAAMPAAGGEAQALGPHRPVIQYARRAYRRWRRRPRYGPSSSPSSRSGRSPPTRPGGAPPAWRKTCRCAGELITWARRRPIQAARFLPEGPAVLARRAHRRRQAPRQPRPVQGGGVDPPVQRVAQRAQLRGPHQAGRVDLGIVAAGGPGGPGMARPVRRRPTLRPRRFCSPPGSAGAGASVRARRATWASRGDRSAPAGAASKSSSWATRCAISRAAAP